jgi:hypothetical protein
MQRRQNLNQFPRPTKVKTWLARDTMSPLGRELMEIAGEVEASDDKALDEDAIERELIRRRGGYSENDE